MPSLRKRVSSYLRQLSFHNEPRDRNKNNINENAFVTKYLQGLVPLREGPPIIYGKNPTDLPNYEVGKYQSGPDSALGCYSGPNGGLTTIKRTEKHLSIPDDDIDFIDNPEEEPGDQPKSATADRNPTDSIALPLEWSRTSDFCYGISDSLYDRNQVSRQKNGDPIADCFGIVTRSDSALLAVADGVNWGEKASVAAKAAVHGALHYLNKTIFNDTTLFEKGGQTGGGATTHCTNLVTNTREVFVCLLRAFNCAHDLILENQGMLTTLTVAVILPLKERAPSTETSQRRYVCCSCNVGDTLGYVYSQKYGVRELTKGSHDVTSNRDMRDALGALGPVDGQNPELSNLTLSVTTVSAGDVVMLASDGLTDNFDPNVCKFTVNSSKSVAAPKKAVAAPAPSTTSHSHSLSNRSYIPQKDAVKTDDKGPPVKPPRRSKNRGSVSSHSTNSERSTASMEKSLPKSDHAEATTNKREERTTKRKETTTSIKADSKSNTVNVSSVQSKKNSLEGSEKRGPSGLAALGKSKTALELGRRGRRMPTPAPPTITRNEEGLPFVSPLQRYELQLLLMEDVLRRGISGRDAPVSTAKRLCETLVGFVTSITAAKRRTLEDPELYFDSSGGTGGGTLLVEVSEREKRIRRKKGMEKAQPLPGKLDHVTVVAWNVANAVAQ